MVALSVVLSASVTVSAGERLTIVVSPLNTAWTCFRSTARCLL
jgi:hypothetical protein